MRENIFIGLVNNAAILMALGLIYDTVFRKRNTTSYTFYHIATGLFIGIMAIVLMAHPVKWESEVIFDTRTILLGLTGLFFGAIPTFTATIVAVAYRLNIGGTGAVTGAVTIISASLVGLIWRHYRFRHSQVLSMKELYLFGITVHITMILCMFLLPPEILWKFIKVLAVPILIIYPIATVLLGMLLVNKRQQMFIEDELRESENMLKMADARHTAMIENIGDVISIMSDDGVLKYISPNSKNLTGFTPDELLETSAWDNVHHDDLTRVQYIFKNLLKNDNAIKTIEYMNKCKDGIYKQFEITAVNRLKDTAINGILLNCHDISDRKKAEFALASEKEQLTVTLRSIGDGVITTDIQGNVVMLNKVAEDLTGWISDEATGHPLPDIFNIINEITRKKCENPVEQVLKNGEIVELSNHTCLISKNGHEIIIADSGAPIKDTEDQIIGVVLVFRDMTEKQRFDEAIQKTQKLESLGVLAGGIAHDFNNLLGGIFGYIELALLESTDAKVSIYLDKSLSNIERARALTQQLLTFAKGGVPIKKIEELFPFVNKTVKFALSGTSISSTFDVQKDLWLCEFDKNQIAQVIDNIIINAQQAMPNGGEIDVTAKNVIFSEHENLSLIGGKYVKLSFKDYGIGMPKEFLDRIFDPYYTTKSRGQGLGLASCYSIIRKHDGCIDVESKPGKGSTFHLYLPASTDVAKSLKSEKERLHKGHGTFLVMDDDESIRKITKKMVEFFGYNVILTNNGQEAIDFFMRARNANEKIAGMIFDLTVQGNMGGKEAINEVRKVCKDTPAFVASGYSSDPIMAEPQKYGFTASISKPFTRTELSKLLEKYLHMEKE